MSTHLTPSEEPNFNFALSSLTQSRVHQYKYKLGQWGRKKNSKKVEREGGTPRNAIHQRTRVSKSPIDRKRSVPSRFIFNAIPSLLPQPEIYQPSATVIGSSRNFIYGLFQRDRGKWTWDDHQLRPPTGSHDSSNVWTSLLDKTETTSMLLQVKGGNQTRKAHRSRNPSSEKRESQHQMFQILHQIYADLFDVAKQSTPSTLYGFWQICHQFSGLCSRMKPGIACTHDLSAFLGHLKELFRIVHGLHHPLSHVLDALCSIPSDEEHKLKHIIRLGHEATVRTLEEILPTNHDLVLHLWSRHLKGWDEKRPRDSPFFTKYVQIINESESSTALSDDVRLSRLYEYTFASYYHSDDDELRVRLAHELVQRAFAIRRSTASQLRYDTTCKSIYLATSILGVHYKFVKDTSRLSEVSDAIERLQGGDNECRMRAADLARFLARTYKNFNMSEESSAAYKRFLTIRSSISGVNAY